MAVYNSETYLTDSIRSILRQTYPDWALICVEDGSNDGSLGILRRYESTEPRVRVITWPNTGVTRARNDESGPAVRRSPVIGVLMLLFRKEKRRGMFIRRRGPGIAHLRSAKINL